MGIVGPMSKVTNVNNAIAAVEEQLPAATVDWCQIEGRGRGFAVTVGHFSGKDAHYEIVDNCPFPDELPPQWQGIGWESDCGPRMPGQPFSSAGPDTTAPRTEFNTLEEAVDAAVNYGRIPRA